MDNTEIKKEGLEARSTSLVKPEHEINYIKAEVLKMLYEEFFVSKDDPARQYALDFMEASSQARLGIANASSHEEIIKSLEIIQEPAKKFKDITTPDTTLGLLIGQHYNFLETENPANLIAGLSQSFQDKYNSGFFDEQIAPPPKIARVAAFFKSIDDDLRDAMGMKRLPDSELVKSTMNQRSKFEFTRHTTESLLNSSGSTYDKDKAAYMKMDEELVQPMLQKFGFNSFIANNSNTALVTKWVENFTQGAEKVAQNMGMTHQTLGQSGTLGLMRNEQKFNCGSYSPHYNVLSFPNCVEPSTILHEWTHSVDFNSLKRVEKEQYQEVYGNNEQDFARDFLHHTRKQHNIHASVSNLDILIKDTPKVKGVLAVRDIMATALAGNIEDVKKHQNRERNDLIKSFWRENLGNSYHALPKIARQTLDSESTFINIRNSIKRPNENSHKEALVQTLISTGIDNPEILEKIRNPNLNSTFHQNAPDQIIKMENVNIGKKSLFKFQAGILDGIKNASTAIGGPNGGGGNADHTDYFRSNVEMLARYVESNAFPKRPSDVTELLWRKHGVDKSWNEQRRQLIATNFGENALSDSPMNQIPENTQKNSFLKTSITLIQTIASEKFEQLKETFQKLKDLNNEHIEPAGKIPIALTAQKQTIEINTPNRKIDEPNPQQYNSNSSTRPKM